MLEKQSAASAHILILTYCHRFPFKSVILIKYVRVVRRLQWRIVGFLASKDCFVVEKMSAFMSVTVDALKSVVTQAIAQKLPSHYCIGFVR